MSNQNELKPPEGWVSEGGNSTSEIREPSDPTGPNAPDSEWMHESRPDEKNPATEAFTGMAIGAGSKVVNPITTKVINKVADVISGPHPENLKPSIYRPQPANPVMNWVKSQHIVSDYSPAAGAEHYKEAHQKMIAAQEARKKAEILQKAENLFKTQEEIRKAATPVADTVRTVSNVMTPTGESLIGKGVGLAAHTLGRAFAGGSALYQGTDAYNRWQRGDYPGAVMSGVGALGSGVAMIPTPITRVVGTGLGIGGELGTTLLDKYRESQQPEYTPQPIVIPMSIPEQKAQGGLVHLASGGQPNVQQIQSNISPQEQAIIDYHRNTIASGNVGRDEHGNPVTVYSNTVNIPSGPHAGKVATVPGYYNNQIHNNPQEIQSHWADQINQGKWPIYYDARTGDTRAKYIHGVMDQEPTK